MTANKSGPAQKEPRPDADYSRFPRVDVNPGLRRWRCQRKTHTPWYYESGSAGRFNLDEPFGTMYVASGPGIALREAAGVLMVGAAVIDSDWANKRALSAVIGDNRRLANFRSSRAVGFGIVPGEIPGSFREYALTRSWAEALHRRGMDGIRIAERPSSVDITIISPD